MTPLVSIVVISHNYEGFLREAIDSALTQSHQHLQVLVVDDGSTDSSREIIRGYGAHVETLFKDNGGNSSAVNAAFLDCRGEIVMFLDADDFLYPNAVARVLEEWDDSCSKVQFRLSLVDGEGVRSGVEPPASAHMPRGDVMPEILAWGHYVTPVMTGNAFRRTTLQQILPIPAEPLFRNQNDGYMNPVCAFYGPIASIDEELGAYRLHGHNEWAYTREVELKSVRTRFQHELVRESYMKEAARKQGQLLPPSLMMRNSNHVIYRLASLKLEPASHPNPGDTISGLLGALPGAVGRNPELDILDRASTLCGGILIALLPRRVARAPVDWILASRPHPGWLRVIARAVRSFGMLGTGAKTAISRTRLRRP